VEEGGQEDQRHVDGRQVIGEPARQIEVGDRCLLRAKMLGDVSERAAEAVVGKTRASAATTPAAMAARRSDCPLNPE
jgi:hypothetical protein